MGGVNSRQPISDDRSVSTIGSRSLEGSNNSTTDHKVKIIPKTTTFTNLDYCNLPPPPPAILLKSQRSRSSGPNSGVFAWKKSSITTTTTSATSVTSGTTTTAGCGSKKTAMLGGNGKSVWSKLAHKFSSRHGLSLNFRQMEDLENNNNMTSVKYTSYYAPEQHSKPLNGPSIFPVAGGSGVFPICRNPVSTIAYTSNHPFKDVTNINGANDDDYITKTETKNRTLTNGVVGHRSNLIGDLQHHPHHHHHHHSDRRKCSPDDKRCSGGTSATSTTSNSQLSFRSRPSSASVAINSSITTFPLKSGANQQSRPHSSILNGTNAVHLTETSGKNCPQASSHAHLSLVPNCKTVVQMQATSSELLSCLGEFLVRRCNRLRHFQTTECVSWIRSVDRALLASGWQDTPFINPANVVFVYMLVRNGVDSSLVTIDELRSTILACLYLAYSYMGNEISYPLKPFLTVARIDPDRRGRFWYRCVRVANDSSWRMLRLNSDPAYFARLFRELKSFSPYYNSNSTIKSASSPSPPIPLSLNSDSESEKQQIQPASSTMGSEYGRIVPGGPSSLSNPPQTSVIAVQ